jgi:predicted DNA-binding transcriptional regulator AlpA
MYDEDQGDRLVDGKEASRITGVCRSRRYALKTFPKRIKIGASTRYSERECRAWVAQRIAERDGGK